MNLTGLKLNAVSFAELPENCPKDNMRNTAVRMRVVVLLLAAAICGLSSAAKTSTMRFIKPIWWPRGSGGGATQARAEAATTAGTGRGLLKKWLLFKSMFQQPQEKVIIITQPATEAPTTTPTTTTTVTTRSAPSGRDNEEFAGKMHASGGDDTDADDDGDADEVPVVLGLQGVNDKVTLDGQQEHRRRRGNHHGAQFNKPPMGSANGGNINNLPVGDDTDDVQSNGRRRKNHKPRNKNRITNSNSAKSRNSNKHGNDVINGSSQVNNDNNHKSSGILNSNGNSRIHSILNALRRQSPIIYNH